MPGPSNSRRNFLALSTAAPIGLAMVGSASAQSAGAGAGAVPGAAPGAQPAARRVALVTGASRGIGAATARRLARDGYAVTVNYLTRRDLAAQVVRDIEAAGGQAIARQADVADPAAVRALFEASQAAFGGLDVVVNNAGIMNVGPFAEMTDEAFQRMIATNMTGSFNVLREAARRIRDDGRIISLSSSIIRQMPAMTGVYTATKAAQEAYSSILAKELAGRGISVNAVSPGAVDTQLLRQHGEAALRGIPEATPLRRLGRPEDIADTIAFLCTREGGWINGQNVFANGGIA